MTRAPSHRRLAFTIPEILFAIGILAVFSLTATRLFHSTMRIGHAAAEQQDAAGSFDSALSALRADVWTSRKIASPDAATVQAGDVKWSVNETTLARDAGDGSMPRTWQVPAGLTFAADGARLVLRLPRPKNSDRDAPDVVMVSQPLLLARLTS